MRLLGGDEKALQRTGPSPDPQTIPGIRFCRREKARGVAEGLAAMLENLGLAIAILSIFSGSALLYDAATAADVTALFRLLAGAALLTAGLVTAALVVRSKLHWRQFQKQNRP